jgi:hypothetical protein
MNEKQKHEDKLPVYEVEFIPVERRLRDRRSNPPSGEFGIERRRAGRRKTDAPPPPGVDREDPPPAAPPDRGKK